jgi:NitT/TauT family transport system substrate-binding protein
MSTRRKFLARAMSAGAVVTGFPFVIRAARAADQLVFMTPSSISSEFIDMENAVSGGHWARQGIDARVIGAPGTSVALAQVISGQAQFGMCAGVDYIRAVATKGAPLIAVGTINQTSAFFLVSLRDKPILKAQELEGKTVGVLSLGGSTETYVDLMAASAGLKKGDVKVIPAGNSPGEVELIKQGRIDCFLATFTVVFNLHKANAPVEAWNVERYAPAPGQVYWTRRDLVFDRADYVQRVMRGLKASVVEIVNNPIAPILERVSKDFEVPGMRDLSGLAELERGMVDQLWLAKGKENLLRNNPADYQAAADAFRQLGIADIKDPATLYTNKFVDAM